MKIAILTILYDNAIKYLYEANPELKNLPYKQQKECVDEEISLWSSGWEHAFSVKGIETHSIQVNVKPLLLKWAEENDFNSVDLNEISLYQLKKIKPDILWYDHIDIALMKRIKQEINSIKLILGWAGSAIMDYEVLKEPDIVLSCAPETVSKLKTFGINAFHLNHAFNPLLLSKINNNNESKDFDVIFIGQIFRGKDFHYRREQLLKKLSKEVEVVIFSSIHNLGISSILTSLAKKFGYLALQPIFKIKSVREKISEDKYIREIIRSKGRKILPFDPVLRNKSKKEVYGLSMYQTIRNSLIVLNIHADSSPEYASNMRLFETTGVGTCLLTDWKKKLSELFIEDEEIVAYKSASECLEKVKWLINNPDECMRIGSAGQKSTLTRHTYEKRLEDLLNILSENSTYIKTSL